MNMSMSVYLLVILMLCVLPSNSQKKPKLSLKPTPVLKRKSCTTQENRPGICVHYSNCNDGHEIERGGVIIDSELRIGSECKTIDGEWCCSEKNVTESGSTSTTTNKPKEITTLQPVPRVTQIVTTKGKKCVVTSNNECPWLVKLYRGEDYAYCLGALIGPKTILTTATCLIQAPNELWVRVPGSTNPVAKYTIISRLKHPKYNSGTRLNDLAILTTQSSIEWGPFGSRGACIDPEQTMKDECTAANIDDFEDLKLVPVFVTPGSCNGRGNVSDTMCAHLSTNDDLLHGAPIMCPKDNMYILSGFTKMSYPSSKALLGRLDYTWVIENLKSREGLSDADFLYKLNY